MEAYIDKEVSGYFVYELYNANMSDILDKNEEISSDYEHWDGIATRKSKLKETNNNRNY